MMRKAAKNMGAIMLSVMMVFSMMPAVGNMVDGAWGLQNVYASTLEYNDELTFSESGITSSTEDSGCTIDGTTLTISKAGVYRVTGSCSEGSIAVAKGLSGVTLVLDDLSLTSSETAPIVIKKNATVDIHLEGSSTLTDDEDPANETSSDTTVADAFEGACIKVKSGSTVTFCGSGDLNAVANAKNGIKGGSTAALVFNQSGTITVSGSGKYYGATKSGAAVNNGIASDGSLEFNQGDFVIKAANDGIKSAPDATDESEGTTIDTDSAGTVTINGGSFDLDVDGDGIQADTALSIAAGDFDIVAYKGYGTWNDTLADQYSCKGLKAGGDRAKEAGLEPTVTITGGTFAINTGDDAVHSDAYAVITGGSFEIDTGDDGMHADTSLILGTEGSVIARDPDVCINNSYEGLEGGTVYLYSGRYNVAASDDGVNAAGGSANGSEGNPGMPGDDGFNPGGGGPGGGQPGGGMGPQDQTSTSDYNIYIEGGDLYVNCSGDGLDSNGGLYLTGGTQIVCSQSGSGADNSAIDADGTVSIAGATILTAGTAGVDGTANSSWFGSGQKYVTSTTSYASGSVVNAAQSGSVVFSTTLPKASSYTMFSMPSTSSLSLATASSVTACKGGSRSHNWNSGSTSNGMTTYTCTKCGETEKQTAATSASAAECSHEAVERDESGGDDTVDEGYAVTFAGDEGVASITVYATQDTEGDSETVASDGSTVSRNSDTGAADSTGSGQVNFLVNLNDGYTLSSVTATEGTYKNIKNVSDNLYRITKITAATTVTITTVRSEEGSGDNDQGETTDPVSVSIPTGKTLTYNGSVRTGVAAGAAYTITGNTAKNAGTYTAKLTLKDTSAYVWADGTTGAKTVKWKIVKAANKMKVSSVTRTIKKKVIAKKAKTVAGVKVRKANGTVTYKISSVSKSKFKKYFKINKKTGKITVKKGLKKGTYKVKVKVKAAGNANYKASAWKTVTVKVKVK